MLKIAITNEKGGCGKTTTAVNVAAILAERGYRVLLVDTDPQSYATMYYGLYSPSEPSLYDVLRIGEAGQAIKHTNFFALDVLRSCTRLSDIEEHLTKRKLQGESRFMCFSEAMGSIEDNYDFAVIDCPPQGYKLLEAVHACADSVLIPMIPDEFALHSLRIKAEKIIELRRTINPHLKLLGGLIVMDEKNATKTAYRDALQSQSVLPFFRATVRKNITLSRAINAHEPINIYARRSNGNLDYQAVVDEILRRVEK